MYWLLRHLNFVLWYENYHQNHVFIGPECCEKGYLFEKHALDGDFGHDSCNFVSALFRVCIRCICDDRFHRTFTGPL